MIFAQTNRYARNTYALAPDDREGAGVAHQDFLRAILAHSMVDAVHLFLETYPSTIKFKAGPGFEELKREFPGKSIAVQQAADLKRLTAEDQYVFYSSGCYLAPLAQLRLIAGGDRFPVCSLTHALDVPVPLLFFPGAILMTRPYDAIIASSEAAKKAIQNLIEATADMVKYTLSLEKLPHVPKVIKIPLGVDADFLSQKNRFLAREILALPEPDTILLYVGRISEDQKADLEPLLVVFRKLLERYPQNMLVIAGQDVEEQYCKVVESLASSFGVRNRVRMIVNFPYFIKPLIYSAADIFVSPVDNIQETFGLSVLEAMACGLPVVASDWSGYRDLVVHEETGFLVPTLWNPSTAETVSKILPICHGTVRRRTLSQHTTVDLGEMHRYLCILSGNIEMRNRFGNMARQRVLAEFAWPVIIRRHEALWEEQWDEIRSSRVAPDCSYKEDLTTLFGHYATTILDTAIQVTCPAGGLRSREELRVSASRASGLQESRLSAILDLCDQRSISLAMIADAVGDSAMKYVSWLLKKGFLERVINFEH